MYILGDFYDELLCWSRCTFVPTGTRHYIHVSINNSIKSMVWNTVNGLRREGFQYKNCQKCKQIHVHVQVGTNCSLKLSYLWTGDLTT